MKVELEAEECLQLFAAITDRLSDEAASPQRTVPASSAGEAAP
jgi:hypothetical protein